MIAQALRITYRRVLSVAVNQTRELFQNAGVNENHIFISFAQQTVEVINLISISL